MRLSIKTRVDRLHARQYQVYFNGVDISNIYVMADDEAGKVEVLIGAFQLGRSMPFWLYDTDRKPITATLYGRVEIRKRHEHKAVELSRPESYQNDLPGTAMPLKPGVSVEAIQRFKQAALPYLRLPQGPDEQPFTVPFEPPIGKKYLPVALGGELSASEEQLVAIFPDGCTTLLERLKNDMFQMPICEHYQGRPLPAGIVITTGSDLTRRVRDALDHATANLERQEREP